METGVSVFVALPYNTSMICMNDGVISKLI